MYSSAGAKARFFLTPVDLKLIPNCQRGGWGCGNMKLYDKQISKIVGLLFNVGAVEWDADDG